MAKKNDGFTLTELIVVVAIMSIVAAAAVPALNGAIKKATFTRALQFKQRLDHHFSILVLDLQGDYPSIPSLDEVIEGGTVESVSGDATTYSEGVE